MVTRSKSVLIAGSTGYIGEKVTEKLIEEGYNVSCIVRPNSKITKFSECRYYYYDITDSSSITALLSDLNSIDCIISCLGTRGGGVIDSWQVEYNANLNLLNLAKKNSISRFVLLSAICVQKPKLEFQYAKLAFEKELIDSIIPFTIIRPTAFFKSLSGQINNLRNGKRFIIFDDGQTTSCKPISETDLATFIVDSIKSEDKLNKILPIGGPGPAITPLQMGKMLFQLTGQPERYRKIPSGIFRLGSNLLRPFGLVSKKTRDFEEFLKIAHYYATESMLLWDEQKNIYNQESTPEFGSDTLKNHFKKLLQNDNKDHELGLHKLF